ncbi:RNA-binding KH domain-containing protein [Wolffia australiana]
MAGQRSNYGKRPHSQMDYDDNGSNKRRNSGDDRESYAPGPDDAVYRYLCPSGKIGTIIGRGGDIVKQLRSETHAKIRIGDTIPGCEYRVITIFSTCRKTNTFDDTGDDISPAQDALFRVHERLAAEEGPIGGDRDMDAPIVTGRLLVPSDQIGCIIGKGGQIIQAIRSETGAQVRVLKNELPPCALSGDELLQISGEARFVRRALFQVSNCLRDNPSRSQHLLISPGALPSMSQFGMSAGGPVMGPIMTSYGGYRADAGADWPSFYPPPRDESSSREFFLRLVCPSALIGGVIGKGGTVIKQIRQESGASIKVDSSTAEDDCIISISSREFFEDPISPTIDAAVRLQPRCSEKTERESGEVSYITRLLVPSSKIGCLIGKGGSIISEMRRATRANIRILSKENLPKVASDDEEMVQISGDHDVTRSALIQLTTRLKANFFEREATVSTHLPPVPYISFGGDAAEMMKYGGRDSRGYGRGYSSYSTDMGPEGYSGYGSSQPGGSNYSAYSGYSSGRSGSSGLNGLSHGKHHGY